MSTQEQSHPTPSISDLFSIERVVTILTPLVFAPFAVVIAGWAARNGLKHVDPTAVIAFEGAVFVSAVGIAGKWLHGRQNPALIARPQLKLIEGGLATTPPAGQQQSPSIVDVPPPVNDPAPPGGDFPAPDAPTAEVPVPQA